MKFTPKHLSNNVDVSKTHRLTKFFWLVGGFIFIVGTIYLLLGFTTDWAVTKAPIRVEKWLGQMALKELPNEIHPPLTHRLQLLLETLPPDSPLHQYQFTVFLVDGDDVNAFALPGGNIVIYKGLLEAVTSENELAMVLAHELGHFAHRDHLRRLGQGLGLTVASVMIFGENSAVSNFLATTLSPFNHDYSKSQETAADQFGLELLTKRYGHAGGATNLFTHMATGANNQTAYLLASHPYLQTRVAALEKLIKHHHDRIETTEPLHEDIKIKKSKR